MKRTTIMLPTDLRAFAVARARERGITFAEFLRELLRDASRGGKGKRRDPVFVSKKIRGLPPDASQNFDDVVYGR